MSGLVTLGATALLYALPSAESSFEKERGIELYIVHYGWSNEMKTK